MWQECCTDEEETSGKTNVVLLKNAENMMDETYEQ